MRYRVSKNDKVLKGEITLEGSKSITNRVLIIKALCEDFFEIKNFSKSDDSETLFELINSHDKVLNAKDGGTTFRFLSAFLTVHEGEVILTGSDRLIDRPIGPLIDALQQLGANIQYLGKVGYPPILINGKAVQQNRVEVDASRSSQFVSALLLIAPILKQGLVIKLKGDIVSASYIQMTLNVMKHFGVHYSWGQNMISISHQPYAARDFRVEADWSAASYYYAMAAMSDEVDLKLYGLHKMSMQGDAVITKIMQEFGVMTTYIENGVHLYKNGNNGTRFMYDFLDCPDIAQTLLACCAGLNMSASISGISNLQIKETNRIQAMSQELAKLNYDFKKENEEWVLNSDSSMPLPNDLAFDTYQDHRMAMALTPLAITYKNVIINDPGVVSKSYPSFWDDIKSLGFQIEELS